MKKGKVRYTIKNNDLVNNYEGNCLFHEEKNILIYKEQNEMEVMLELDRLLLTRENQDMFLMLDFYGGESYILLKNTNEKVQLNLTVYKKEIKENSLSVNYSLSSDNIFYYDIEWVLEGDY